LRKVFGWIADHPVVTVALVLVATAAIASFIPRLETETDFSTYIDPNDPDVVAMRRAEARYGSQSLLMVTLENESGIFDETTLARIDRIGKAFAEIPGVEEVTTPLNGQVITGTATSILIGPAAPQGRVPATAEEIAAFRERALGSATVRDYLVASDGKAAVISIGLRSSADELDVTEKVVEILRRDEKGEDRLYPVGLSYMSFVLTETMTSDLFVLVPLMFAAIVLVLYASFRSLRGVFLPLLVVTLSAVWALGLMGVFRVPVTIISFILPVILLAIGIAYGIHVLNRFYEAVASGLDRRAAVVTTGMEMVAPVSMAGLTTGAGFLSLTNSVLVPQRQFGVYAGVGVIAAMVLSLVLIPALLSLLPVPRRRATTGRRGPVVAALAGFRVLVLRHRRLVLVVSVVLFVGFLAGLPLLRIETSDREFLGETSPAVRGMDVMERHFAGSEQVIVEIDTGTADGLKDPALLKEIVALEDFLGTWGVKKTMSLADLVREMNRKFHADDPAYDVVPEDRKLVSQLLVLFTFQGGSLGDMALRDFSAGEVMGLYPMESSEDQVRFARAVEGYLVRHFVGSVHAEMIGSTPISANLHGRIATSQISSLGTSIVACGLIVALLMGSIVAGLVALIPLLVTVAVNFGVMAYSGTALNMATLMVSSIAIGMGIDYAIHFLSRYRREVQAGKGPDDALTETVFSTGRGIAYNVLSLALGFVLLLASAFRGTRDFGLFVAMTMVVSGLSAFTVIPAVLVTWSPKFLRREAWGRWRRKGPRNEGDQGG